MNLDAYSFSSESQKELKIKSKDSALSVKFYKKIYDEIESEWIEIIVPGDKTLKVDRVANDIDKRRFSDQYKDFVLSSTMTSGTLIEEMSDLPKGVKQQLAFLGFEFVEQLANASDSVLSTVMGGNQWRSKAKDFINKDKVSLNDLLAKQQAQINDLMSQLSVIKSQDQQTRKKRGNSSSDDAESLSTPGA